jgi:hypothetical protein
MITKKVRNHFQIYVLAGEKSNGKADRYGRRVGVAFIISNEPTSPRPGSILEKVSAIFERLCPLIEPDRVRKELAELLQK